MKNMTEITNKLIKDFTDLPLEKQKQKVIDMLTLLQ
jgi:hypothetical protein